MDKINCFAIIISLNAHYVIHCDDRSKNNPNMNTFDFGFALIITVTGLKIIHCDYKSKTIQTNKIGIIFVLMMNQNEQLCQIQVAGFMYNIQ